MLLRVSRRDSEVTPAREPESGMDLQVDEPARLLPCVNPRHRAVQRRQVDDERLFDFPIIGPLSAKDAATALVTPARREGVKFTDGALDRIISETLGYPYFVQEWGKHCWDAAGQSPITAADVETASRSAIAALDESFFRVRFDRLTPSEKLYLRAMATLGPGPHRSGDIASELGREVRSVAPPRSNLIQKGMIWSPSHGDTAFTVPLFDQFMGRIMPGNKWRE